MCNINFGLEHQAQEVKIKIVQLLTKCVQFASRKRRLASSVLRAFTSRHRDGGFSDGGGYCDGTDAVQVGVVGAHRTASRNDCETCELDGDKVMWTPVCGGGGRSLFITPFMGYDNIPSGEFPLNLQRKILLF